MLVELDEAQQIVESALKTGDLITVPLGRAKPGSLQTFNPEHVVAISDGMGLVERSPLTQVQLSRGVNGRYLSFICRKPISWLLASGLISLGWFLDLVYGRHRHPCGLWGTSTTSRSTLPLFWHAPAPAACQGHLEAHAFSCDLRAS